MFSVSIEEVFKNRIISIKLYQDEVKRTKVVFIINVDKIILEDYQNELRKWLKIQCRFKTTSKKKKKKEKGKRKGKKSEFQIQNVLHNDNSIIVIVT